MEGNAYKCHLLLNTGDSNQIQIENSLIKGGVCEKLLGVKFDHKLTFDQDVKCFSKKANVKLKALAKFVPYMGLAKKNEFLFCRTIQLLSPNMDNS